MVSGIFIAFICLPALLTVFWFVQVVTGCIVQHGKSPRRVAAVLTPSPSTVVLIPAHNEGAGIRPTIRDVRSQLRPGDRILVIADNCTDNTAAVAADEGAEVSVRTDADRRGKGFALEHGVRHLASDLPDVIIILDADCRLGENAIVTLSDRAHATGRPVQSLYLMLPPEGTPTSDWGFKVFAWRVRNWIRPLGLDVFGLPTQLFGTGMAFPARLLADRDLGNSRLAEDTALGIALASAGRAPCFSSGATVYSHFPSSQAGIEQQRERWEKGHLDNIADLVPAALVRSLRDRNLDLAVLATDMAVPPLSLLVIVTVVCQLLGLMAVAMGAPLAAFAVPFASVVLLGLGSVMAWIAVGRDLLPVRELLRLPLHVLRKVGFYHRIASGKATSNWVRTDRK